MMRAQKGELLGGFDTFRNDLMMQTFADANHGADQYIVFTGLNVAHERLIDDRFLSDLVRVRTGPTVFLFA